MYPDPKFSTGGGGTGGTLQQVTDLGNVTNDPITVAKLLVAAIGVDAVKAAITYFGNEFNGTVDKVLNIGINVNNGGPADITKSCNFLQLENNYVDVPGGSPTNEFFINLSGPNGDFSKRVYFIKHNQVTGVVTHEVYADQFIIGAGDETDMNAGQCPIFIIYPKSGEIHWKPNITYDSMIISADQMGLLDMSLRIESTVSGSYAGIALFNDTGKSWNIAHRGTTAGNGQHLCLIHTDGTSINIAPSGNIGINSAANHCFTARTSGANPAYLDLGCEASSSGIVLHSNSTFRYQINCTQAGQFEMYQGSTGKYALIITTQGNVGFNGLNGNAPAACAQVDINSENKGLLLPRMTKAQRDAIAAPINGLVVYQTDNTPGIRCYNGVNWMRYTETID